MTVQKIKTLSNDLDHLQTEQKLLKMKQSSIQSDIDKIKNRIKIERQEIRVSDHALIRYLERKLELDLDNIRGEIMSDKLMTYTETLGKSGKFTVNDMDIVMKNGVIVTVY